MVSFVQVERRGPVVILTLNHPESMNAIGSHEDCRDLVAAIDHLTDDRSVSAAVLTGAGRAFSAGGNLRAMKDRVGIGPQEQPDSSRFNYRRGIQRITEAFMACEVPLVAAINGHAIGLGCDLACLCDIRIAAQSASFAASFIKIGLVPGDGGAWSLQKAIGYARAAEMLLTGDRYSADEVAAFGLVNKVVPDETLMDEALKMAGRIVANPARSLRLTKRLLREAQTQRMSEILELSAAYQAMAHETADHTEALDAFFEKRPPVFTGA